MSSRAAVESVTLIPSDDESAEVIDLVQVLRARGRSVSSEAPARLVLSDGASVEIPEDLVHVLLMAAENLAAGRAFSAAPLELLLTTQEAADYLGMSRPSLIKLVDSGQVPCTKLNRHRRIRLADAVEYQRQQAERRSAALDAATALAADHGLYESTATALNEQGPIR